MAIGSRSSSGTVDQQLTDIAVSMRNIMQAAANMSRWINGRGGGQPLLESMGYSPADAAAALSSISYLNTVAAVYFGTAAQPTSFDFNNQLSSLWAGRV